MEAKKVIIYLAIKHQGDWAKILDNIKNLTEEDAINSEYPLNLKCEAITILDKEYPESLKQIYRPPFVLFYYGDISLISNFDKCLGIVGTRNPSTHYLEHLDRVVEELPKDMIIVSGLAKGVDGFSHQSAINHGLKTIAVLGTGIDICYPSENRELFNRIKQNYLLISEYPPGTITSSDKFPVRNRIISGLSKVVFIPEGKIRSGTSTTATFATQQNRDVCCFPGPIGEESLCNLLIKQGAFLVENGQDIIDLFELKNYYSK